LQEAKKKGKKLDVHGGSHTGNTKTRNPTHSPSPQMWFAKQGLAKMRKNAPNGPSRPGESSTKNHTQPSKKKSKRGKAELSGTEGGREGPPKKKKASGGTKAE